MDNKRSIWKVKRIKLLLFVVVLAFCSVTKTSYAIDLVDENSAQYQEIYVSGQTGTTQGNTPSGSVREVGPLEELLSVMFAGLADEINFILINGPLDLTIDGIVYGRMERNVVMDVARFGLEENNPYGIFGASLYYILRDVAFAVIPVVILILLVIQLFHNTQRGRMRLKEVITNAVVFFVAMILTPYLLEFYIFARDACMYVTGDGFSNLLTSLNSGSIDLGNGIYDTMRRNYNDNRTLVNSIFMLATSTMGLFYLWDYVKIAIMLALTFGLFPVLLVFRFFKPRILQDWMDMMLPSLAIPFIDMVMLMIPTVISAVYASLFGSGSGEFVIGVVMLCCVWAARPVRDKVLQKLFGFDGNVRGAGSPFMAMAMLARSFSNRGGGHVADRGSGSTGSDNIGRAAEQKEYGEVLREADRRIDDMRVPSVDTGYGFGRNNDAVEEFLRAQETGDVIGDSLDAETVDEMSGISETVDADMGAERVMDSEAVSTMEELSGADKFLDEEPLQTSYEEKTEPVPGLGGVELPLGEVSFPDAKDTTGYAKYAESDTYATMSERDKKRFHNLSQLGELERRMRDNERIMAGVGYSDTGFEEMHQTEMDNNSRLRQTEDRLLAERNQIADTSSDAYAKADSSYQRAYELRSMSDEKLIRMDGAQKAAYENAVYRQQAEYCKSVENTYAKNSEFAGMSGRTFKDADEFYYSKRVEQIAKKQADFRNFDSGRYDGILTPQEKEEFYRQRAVYQGRERMVRAVGNIGGVAAGVVGGALMMGGGPNTTAMGAMVGYSVGNRIMRDNVAEPLAEPVRHEPDSYKKEERIPQQKVMADSPRKGSVATEERRSEVSSLERVARKVNQQADRVKEKIEQ